MTKHQKHSVGVAKVQRLVDEPISRVQRFRAVLGYESVGLAVYPDIGDHGAGSCRLTGVRQSDIKLNEPLGALQIFGTHIRWRDYP